MFINCFIFYFFTEFMILLILTLNLINSTSSWKKVLFACFLHSLIISLSHPYLLKSYYLNPILAFFIYSFLAIIIIKYTFSINFIKSFLITLISFSIYIPLTNMIFALRSIYYGDNCINIFKSFQETFKVSLAIIILIIVVYYIIKRFSAQLSKYNFDKILNNNRTKEIIWTIILILAENLIIMHYLTYNYIYSIQEQGKENKFFFLTLVVFAIVFIIILRLLMLIEDEIELAIDKKELDNLTRLNFILKNKQHDFKQHLQLIMALIQMGNAQKALNYMKNVTEEIQEINNISNTGITSLDGLLQYKLTLAKKNNINLHVKIASLLKNLPLEESMICRIIGNLLDNAIDYLKDKEGLEKVIQLIIEETENIYIINVSNPVFSEKIFEKGVKLLIERGKTTKGEGHGLGLHIIKEILSNIGGKIEPYFDKEEGIIVFNLTIPKQKFPE